MTHEYRRITCSFCGYTHDVPVWCGDRWCPVCAVSRRMRLINRMNWLAENTSPLPGHQFYFLTLTIVSNSDLAKQLRSLVRSFRKLRQRAFWKKHVNSGAFIIETKLNEAGWHCHIHALIFSRWLDWDFLLSEWIKVSTGRGVFIVKCKPSAISYYVTKYMTKPDLPDADLTEINAAMKGLRLFSPFGKWQALSQKYPKPKMVCEICGKSQWVMIMNADDHFPSSFWHDSETVNGKQPRAPCPF